MDRLRSEYVYGYFSDNPFVIKFEIPYGVTHIEKLAFYDCPMLSVVIPDTVKYIAKQSFVECKSLKTLKIPKSVIFIGPLAIFRCDELSCIESESLEYPVENNCLYAKKSGRLIYAIADENGLVSLPDAVKVFDENCFSKNTKLVQVGKKSKLEAINGDSSFPGFEPCLKFLAKKEKLEELKYAPIKAYLKLFLGDNYNKINFEKIGNSVTFLYFVEKGGLRIWFPKNHFDKWKEAFPNLFFMLNDKSVSRQNCLDYAESNGLRIKFIF